MINVATVYAVHSVNVGAALIIIGNIVAQHNIYQYVEVFAGYHTIVVYISTFTYSH